MGASALRAENTALYLAFGQAGSPRCITRGDNYPDTGGSRRAMIPAASPSSVIDELVAEGLMTSFAKVTRLTLPASSAAESVPKKIIRSVTRP
jgi:hypothetical protein